MLLYHYVWYHQAVSMVMVRAILEGAAAHRAELFEEWERSQSG